MIIVLFHVRFHTDPHSAIDVPFRRSQVPNGLNPLKAVKRYRYRIRYPRFKDGFKRTDKIWRAGLVLTNNPALLVASLPGPPDKPRTHIMDVQMT